MCVHQLEGDPCISSQGEGGVHNTLNHTSIHNLSCTFHTPLNPADQCKSFVTKLSRVGVREEGWVWSGDG